MKTPTSNPISPDGSGSLKNETLQIPLTLPNRMQNQQEESIMENSYE
jgi:hypothetical protein